MTTEIPMKTVANCATGEVVTIPYTAEEIVQAAKDKLAYEAREQEREAQSQARAEAKASALAKLEALGLTEEEAKAIAG
jgi:cbb3-type cytochrome oxidase cytochrome c subunit